MCLFQTGTYAHLDHEAGTNFTITITTKDSGTPSMQLDKTFTVVVQDVNEAPIKVNLLHHSVSWNLSTKSNTYLYKIKAAYRLAVAI